MRTAGPGPGAPGTPPRCACAHSRSVVGREARRCLVLAAAVGERCAAPVRPRGRIRGCRRRWRVACGRGRRQGRDRGDLRRGNARRVCRLRTRRRARRPRGLGRHTAPPRRDGPQACGDAARHPRTPPHPHGPGCHPLHARPRAGLESCASGDGHECDRPGTPRVRRPVPRNVLASAGATARAAAGIQTSAQARQTTVEFGFER